MFRTRRLGVEEGNAIDTIMAYETKVERGIATAEERLAYEAARRVLGAGRGPKTATASPVQDGAEEGNALPSFNHMVNPVSPGSYGDALIVIGAVFVLFALSFVLLFVLTQAIGGLVSLAHP